MKHPHLLAMLLAVFLVATAGSVITHKARRFEAENEKRVAENIFPQKINGSALQRLAFKMRHYLPIYGSSELGSFALQRKVKTIPGEFFISEPTGFIAFPVGRGGTTPLVIAQELAAVGKLALGKKVVVVLSPNWFNGKFSEPTYDGNASLIHIGGLFFGPFSQSLKHDAARRLAELPEPLGKSDLLKLTNFLYADGSRVSLLAARLLQPIGKGWLQFQRVLDDFATVVEIREHHFPNPPPAEHQIIDWQGREAAAEAPSNLESTWIGDGSGEPIAGPPPPRKVARKPKHPLASTKLPKSEVWGDYSLMLRVLHESGAKALILSMPQDGTVEDENNIPYEVRSAYYERVRNMAAKYGYPARTFEEHEYDGNFLISHNAHLTDKGWLFFDQAIDAFYHDKI